MMSNWYNTEKISLLKRIEDDIRWDSQREVLKILSQTLTKKRFVNLWFSGQNTMANANLRTSTITLPYKIYPQPFIDWILKKGITLHESYHLLFTGNAKEFIQKCDAEWKAKNKVFMVQLFRNIVNAIEDARIEFLGVNEYRGSVELLGFTNSFFHKVAKHEKIRINEDVIYALAFEIKGYKTNFNDRKLLDKLVKISKKIFTQNFDGMLNVALNIYKEIEKTLPPDELDNHDNNLFKNHQQIRGFDCELGTPQEFENSGKRNKSKLTEKELNEIKKQIKDIVDDYEEMFGNDENEEGDEKEDESEEKSEQVKSEKSKSDDEGKEDSLDSDKTKDGSDDLGDDNEEDEDSDDEKDSGKSEDKDDDLDENSDGSSGSEKDGEDEDSETEKQEKEEIPKFEDVFDEQTIQKIMKRFEEEKESHDKIEIQIRQRGDQKVNEISKEFDDSSESGLELTIPKKSYSLPFNRIEAESTAKMIADELRNKIVIGKTTLTKQVSGKIHLKSAVRSFVKYDIDGEFDGHIYERDVIETPEHSVLLSIDCSSSMQCSIGYTYKTKMSYAKEVLYIMSKVFEELGVKFSIRGFNTGKDFLVKNWSDEFDWTRLSGLNGDDSTPTAEATDIAKKRMKDVDDELKIIFTITDGEPDSQPSTKQRVDECREDGTLVFGIFYGADENGSTYQKNNLIYVYGDGNFIMAKDYDKLKEGLVKLYEKVLAKSSYGMNGGG